MKLVIEIENGAIKDTYSDGDVELVIVDRDLDEPYVIEISYHEPISDAPKEAAELLDLT